MSRMCGAHMPVRPAEQVKYHEDFEKLKGKVTQVADDPETMRIRQTSKIISNVAYHGELERKSLMEQRRGLLPTEKNGHDHSAATGGHFRQTCAL